MKVRIEVIVIYVGLQNVKKDDISKAVHFHRTGMKLLARLGIK